VLWLIMIVVLALAKGSLTSFVLGRLAVATIETLLILIFAASFLKAPYQIAVRDFKIYLKASIPIALSMLLAGVYLRIDQVMLHSLASDKELGFYAAAVKVSELFELLPAALLASVFPILAINSSDESRMAFYIDRIFRYLMASAGLLCTFICVGAGFIVQTLYGAQFSPTAHLLSVLIWSEFAVFFGTAIANLLLARGLQNYLIYPTIGGAVVNVLLNLLWIRRYGASGSAWATLISYTFAWTVVLLLFNRTRTMIWHGLSRGVPVVLLSLFVSFAANYIPVGPVIRLTVATAVYLFGLGAIKTIKTEDLRYLLSALGPTLSRKA
jgi:O-antigen/teichoic acid export membrane protein